MANVKQDPEKPVEPEILAEAIVRISASMKKLTASGLNRRAIVTLIADGTNYGKGTIEKVLDSLDTLAKKYTR